MKIELLNHEIFNTLAQFLGHSLWVGFLSALIYFLYIKSSPRLTPAERVMWGLGLMVSIPVMSIVFTANGDSLFPFTGSFVLQVPYWLAQYLCGIWLLGVGIYAIRLLSGSAKLGKIRKACSAPDGEKRQMIERICQKLQVPEKLPVQTSNDITGPIICGITRPAIVIPEATVEQSDDCCIESIIAHETAHFHRRDLWINLGQSILDGLFFYHPGVKWLSRQIRLEREKACDDWAIKTLNGKRFHYASALLEAESRAGCASLFAAFGSESTSDRAARIAFGENTERQPLSGLLSGLMVLIVFAISLSVVSVVKMELPVYEEKDIIRDVHIDEPRFPTEISLPEVKWQDKLIGERSVPVLKSVLLVERDGIVYDLTKEEPRLFAEFPNSWLLKNNLNLLSRHLPYTDPDGDKFTVLEEFNAGTEPKDSTSHPDRTQLLTFVERHSKLCRVKYAACPDQITIQLIRMTTAEYPAKVSYFIRENETSPDGRIQLKQIKDNAIVLFDTGTKQTKEVARHSYVDFRTWYAELSVRGGKNFYVKEGDAF